jgi:hypothetical protein
MADKQRIGATGNYPQGKLDDTDEGELTIAITRADGIVRIEFGKPVAWIAMSPEHAVGLARLLLKHAEKR